MIEGCLIALLPPRRVDYEPNQGVVGFEDTSEVVRWR
jgi:hypothetical protein